MRELSHSAEFRLRQESVGAWSLYLACKRNPDLNQAIAALIPDDERRRAIRAAYDYDKKLDDGGRR